MEDQVDDFEDLFTPMPGPSSVDWHGSDTVFFVFFGINDIREEIGRLDITDTCDQLVKAIIRNYRRLYQLGARTFLVMNLPPVHLYGKYNLPSGIGHDIQGRIEESVNTFNALFEPAVNELRDELSQPGLDGVNLMLFDLHGYMSLLLDYPEIFGLTECTRFEMQISGNKVNLGSMGFW
ncbi:hypothetical protein P7C73_g3218, partial [Tremellales sp. Uapishka_1]